LSSAPHYSETLPCEEETADTTSVMSSFLHACIAIPDFENLEIFDIGNLRNFLEFSSENLGNFPEISPKNLKIFLFVKSSSSMMRYQNLR